MRVWYVIIDSQAGDVAHIKRLFASSNFEFREIDGRWGISAPAFEECHSKEEIIEEASRLLAFINTALLISVRHYSGFDIHGLAEIRGDKINRTMFAGSGTYGISGVSAEIGIGTIGTPIRSREERLVSLMAESAEIADIAQGLAVRPVTWPAMRKTFETVKGLMSPTGKRSDHQTLIDCGWISAEDSESLFDTASFHDHGYPRTPIRDGKELAYEDAYKLGDSLFWRLIDAKKPH